MPATIDPLTHDLEDPAFDELLAALPAEDRRSALACADRMREDAPEPLPGRIQRIYMALADDIDPADPAQHDRCIWIVGSLRWLTPDARPFMTRFARLGADEDLRDRASMSLSRLSDLDGDFASARAVLEEVTARHRGRTTNTAARAHFNLARISLMADDHLAFLTHARAADRLIPEHGEPWGSILLGIARFECAMDLEDRDTALSCLDDGSRYLPNLSPLLRQEGAAMIGLNRADFVRSEGDTEHALSMFGEILLTDYSQQDRTRARMTANFRGRALLALGRIAAAQACFDQAQRAGRSVDDSTIETDVFGVELAVAREEREVAIRRTADLLEWMRSDDARMFRSGSRARAAERCGRLLRRTYGESTTARDALETALAVGRPRETQLARQAVVPGETVHEDDLAAVRAGAARQAERNGRVAALLIGGTDAHADGPGRAQSGANDSRTLICAWCGRIGTPDGPWIDASAAVSHSGLRNVTHGVCPDCNASVQREAESASDVSRLV